MRNLLLTGFLFGFLNINNVMAQTQAPAKLPAWAPKPIGTPPAQSKSTPQKAAPASGKPSFEFRSHRIGDAIESRYPNWRDKKRDLFAPGCEPSTFEAGIIQCDDAETYEKSGWGLVSTSTQRLGGVAISSLRYKFYEGRLVSLDMALHIAQSSDIHDMLVGKYGKPARTRLMTLQNRMGASFNSLRSEWDFREGTLRFDQRAGSIDMSWVSFENPAYISQTSRQRELIGQQKAKGAL